VCDENDDNEALLGTVGRPLVESVCAGYNSTLFAYGQTGSGKTYTIGEIAQLGTPHEGVAHRMVRALYAELMGMHCKKFKVSVQFVQIYMEAAHDLLAEGGTDGGNSLKLREDKAQGVYVEGALTLAAPCTRSCSPLQPLVPTTNQSRTPTPRTHQPRTPPTSDHHQHSTEQPASRGSTRPTRAEPRSPEC
jgi:hypothetical protein